MLLLSISSDSKNSLRTANWHQIRESNGESRRITNIWKSHKAVIVKHHEALWNDSKYNPHDEAHRLKSIDSTPFINRVWLIWHHIDTKLVQKRLYKKAESYPLTDDSLLFCLCSCAFLRGSNEVIPPNRLYGPKDFFAGPFLICGDGGEDLISLTDSQITKYEKKYHSPLIFLELYPEPITLKCTPELYAKCMGEEHQHDTQENEHDER